MYGEKANERQYVNLAIQEDFQMARNKKALLVP